MTSPAKKPKVAVAKMVENPIVLDKVKQDTTTPAPVELTLLFKKEELLTKEKDILDTLKDAMADGVSSQRKFQLVALSAVSHALIHGDITIIEKTINGVPEAMRKDSLCAYFDTYACVDFIKDEETKKYKPIYSREKRDNMMKNGWFDAAATNWWYRATKQTEYVPFTFGAFEGQLISLLKKAKKQAAKDLPNDTLANQIFAKFEMNLGEIHRLINSEAVLEQQAETIIAA